MVDYSEAKRAARAAAAMHGAALPGGASRYLNPEQRRHYAGKNIITDERAGTRLLRGGDLVAVVEFGHFIDHYLYGLSVYCVGDLKEQAGKLDSNLSRCFYSAPELEAALLELEEAEDVIDLHGIAQANELGSYKRGSDRYEAAAMLACNPYQRPAEVTAEEAEDMLGAVPPIYPAGAKGFCVGEAITHCRTRRDGRTVAGAVLANYYREGGKWFARYHFAEGERV